MMNGKTKGLERSGKSLKWFASPNDPKKRPTSADTLPTQPSGFASISYRRTFPKRSAGTILCHNLMKKRKDPICPSPLWMTSGSTFESDGLGDVFKRSSASQPASANSRKATPTTSMAVVSS